MTHQLPELQAWQAQRIHEYPCAQFYVRVTIKRP
jgi:hypothetical protein